MIENRPEISTVQDKNPLKLFGSLVNDCCSEISSIIFVSPFCVPALKKPKPATEVSAPAPIISVFSGPQNTVFITPRTAIAIIIPPTSLIPDEGLP